MKFSAIDFETFYDKVCSVKELGAEAYTRHPDYYPYLVAIKVGRYSWTGDPLDPACPWHRIDGIPWVAHNAQFDYWVWKRLYDSGKVKARPSRWYDTTAIPAYLQIKRDLASASRVLLNKDVSKEVRNKAQGKHWKDFDPSSRLLMEDYAAHDAALCYELFEKFHKELPENEWKLSELTMFQGIRGVKIDREALDAAIKTVTEKQSELIAQIPWRDSGRAILSPGALRAACVEAGETGMPGKTAKDDPEWIKWSTSVDLPFVQAFTELRSLKKFYATLHKIKLRLTPEDILHFSLKYCGSRLTGRWAGDAGINLQNLPKGKVFGVNIRNLFIARPGHKLLVSDLSSIEPKVLAFLTEDTEFLDEVRKGTDIYEAALRATGRYDDPRPLKKVNPELRQMSKVKTLGLGYGAGAARFRQFASTFGIHLSEEEAEAEVASWRAANWKIVNYWVRLHQAINEHRGATWNVELPTGRILRYFDIRNHIGSKGKSVSTTIERGLYCKRERVWGSLLVENVVQSLARDVFADAVRRIDKRGIQVLWTVHDEVICEVPDDEVGVCTAIVEEELSREVVEGLPLSCESSVSSMYDK